MGNQLAGIAPSQIFPIEHYLTDVSDIELDISLGSTRFFKVARAKSKEGFVVVKVFTIHDPSLPLKTYKEQLEDIRVRLSSVTNCLPFQKAILTDKAGILIRQYVKDNLYDRISTRPFLNNVEKKWIAFQMLCALNQCHKLKVCHGDIKTENVLVTSWNWLLLSDFASFKPTYLPEDNPADFSYFFDTSRRRTCYIAPERFVKTMSEVVTSGSSSNLVLADSEIKKGDLTPAIDIFSAGCVITELFTEGHPPFDFSQLLAYRSGEYSPWKVLEKIEDTGIRELVRHMMQKDPNNRLSAEEYLLQQRGKAFPEYFYSFLKVYLQGFSTIPLQPADDKISRLKKDSGRILSNLSTDNNDNGGLVIILSLITSCLRSLRFCDSKLHSLQLLLEISSHLSSEIILDRLIPYMLFLINDPFPRVRAEAVRTLTKCLKSVKNVPRSDANIFPEYILPLLSPITQDEAVIVRVAFAENIATLADVALRFLEMTQLHPSPQASDTGHDGSTQYQASYDAELQALHEMFQQKVQTVLSDPDNIVKQTILENGITQLCVFFGRQKANDILSHMITFLNDKHDWQLRGTFFDNIVGVAAYVGWPSSSILKPLLQQGLSDAEEFVMCKTLRAMTNLTELGLIQKPVLYELLTETAALLCHPNLWVRQGTVGFICAVARYLNIADLHCKLLPLIQPFIRQNIIQVDKEVVLLSVLKEPVSRSVYDYIVKSPIVNNLFDSMQDRQLIRNITRSGHKPNYTEVDENLKQLYRKLISQGMTETDEDKLLAMKEFIVKIHKAKTNLLEIKSPDEASRPGYINLTSFTIPRRQSELVKVDNKQELVCQTQNKKSKSKTNRLESPTVIMNEEWQHMFGSMEHKNREIMMTQSLPQQGPSLDTFLNPNTPISMSQLQLSDSQQSPKRNFPSFDKPNVQLCFASCKVELNALLHRKRTQFTEDLVSKEQTNTNKLDFKPHPSGWRPKGHLIAHLHEHKGAVNRIRVNHDSAVFGTCSNDGTVKLWDCARMEGKSVANRARQTFKQGNQIKSFVFCQQNQSVACASDNGSIYLFRIESNASSVEITQSVDKEDAGCVVDMGYYDTGSQSIVTFATVHGYLYGLDLRSKSIAWKLHNDPRHGLITSYAMDPRQCWMVIGTSSGAHVCWDMRFHLPITLLTHPTGARVRRLVMHPSQQSWVASAVQGNNEVSIWDMETGARQMTLWGSQSPPLSLTQASNHSTTSLFISQGDGSPFIVTASTDMKIRYWDLATPARSYVVIGGASDPLNQSLATYMSRLIDGTEVIIESHKQKQSSIIGNTEDIPQRGPDTPPAGHHDCISDMNLCQTTQTFIITASRDGVVKVWK